MPGSIDSLEIRQTGTLSMLERQWKRGSWEYDRLEKLYDSEYKDEEVEYRKQLRVRQARTDDRITLAVLLANISHRIRHLTFMAYLTEIDPESSDIDKDPQA